MKDSMPLVTIGIPFYNPGTYIIETLQSVYDQSYQNIELVLYNDGSTDESYSLVLEWLGETKERFSNVIVVNGSVNKGVGHGCDILFKKASGLYFQMAGADDLLYSDKISSQVDILQRNPDYALTYANMDRIDEKGNCFPETYFDHQKFPSFTNDIPPSGNIFGKLIRENFIPASSVLARRSVIETIGGYDATLKSEDWDMWLRIAKHYKIRGETGVVGAYRILPGSAMHSSKNKVFVLESLNVALVKHRGISKEIDGIIDEHVYKNTIEMYRLGYISRRWSRRLFTCKRGLKPIA
jgi:glycosyltransferase involved in cell wall biosynthesis